MPAGSPRGLCPACLLRRGLEANTIGFSDAPERPQWDPPGIDDLAPHFPELDILELIGRGGMGAVYKAREKQLDRLVALKILPPEIGQDAAFAQRFTREAQSMARLGHHNIVTIHSFGQRGQLYYFLMEYVDGLSLRRVLDAGQMAPKEALAIVPQICDALQYAHDRGIVHRDIKPENILLTRSGQVKIADFGLAKLVSSSTGVSPVSPMGVPPMSEAGAPEQPEHGQDARAPHGRDAHATPQPDVTRAEHVLGTPQYMAPEQRDLPAEVDHRADIYSLGVVFYQMLTGELPQGKFEPPSRKVLIDVRLDEVVLRALEREPARRYQQVSQVKTEVETIVTTRPASPNVSPESDVAPPPPPAQPPQAPAGRADRSPVGKLVLWAARITGTILLIALAVLTYVLLSQERLLNVRSEGVYAEFAAVIACMAGFMIGWRRPGLAAVLILLSWGFFCFIEQQMFLTLPYVFFPLVGLLYAVAWWMSRRSHAWVAPSRFSRLHIAASAAFLVVGTILIGYSLCDGGAVKSRRLVGNVVDAETNRPIANAVVAPDVEDLPRMIDRSIRGASGGTIRADSSGSFVLRAWPRRTWLSVSASGRQESVKYATLRTSTAGWQEGIVARFALQPSSSTTTAPAADTSNAASHEPYQFGPDREGVACKLRANKEQWLAGEEVSFLLDVRNAGQGSWGFSADQSQILVEIDGKWYRYEPSKELVHRGTTYSSLPPGKQVLGIPILLDSRWRELPGESAETLADSRRHHAIPVGRSLSWKQGEHVVRVVMYESMRPDGRALRVESLPVNLDLAAHPTKTTYWMMGAGCLLLLLSWCMSSLRHRSAHQPQPKAQPQSAGASDQQMAQAGRDSLGWEYRSKTKLLGLPLLHVAIGRDAATGRIRKACGIVAVGPSAQGIVAVGAIALGLISVGVVSIGVVALGVLAAAAAAAWGVTAVAPLAFGGTAIGLTERHIAVPYGVLLMQGMAAAFALGYLVWLAVTHRIAASRPASGLAASETRLSRLAVVGAVWAPFAVVAFAAIAWAGPSSGHPPVPGTVTGGLLLKLVLILSTLAGLAAPFGATICGAIAISQIRHSAGRLYGLGLAVFDALLFPLLALDLFVFILVATGLHELLLSLMGQYQQTYGRTVFLFVLFAIAAGLCGVLDWLIIRWVWRKANGPVAGGGLGGVNTAPTEAAGPSHGKAQMVLFPSRPGLMVPLIGRRAGRRVIHWPGVFLTSLMVGAAFTGGAVFCDLLLHRLGQVPTFGWWLLLGAPIAIVFIVGGGIYRAFKLPLEQLVDLDALAARRSRRGGWVFLMVAALALASAWLAWDWMRGDHQDVTVAPDQRATLVAEQNASTLLVHDSTDLHYALVSEGELGSSSSGSYSGHGLGWIDRGVVKQKDGRSFAYLRESADPFRLSVNGQEYDLRRGRVLILHDDGRVEQVRLFPSLAGARDAEGLWEAVKSAQASAHGTDLASLEAQLAIARSQLQDLLKTHSPTHLLAVEVQQSIDALQAQVDALRRDASSKPATQVVNMGGFPPRVTRTTPAAFANDVDPSLDTISVTFDQPMMDKFWSFTAGDKAFSEKTGSTFPETSGEISYDASRTTCTMPVKLQPGKVYWIGINSPQHKAFMSAATGIPAWRYQILFATRSADGKPTALPEELVKLARITNGDELQLLTADVKDNSVVDFETGKVTPVEKDWPASHELAWDNDMDGVLIVHPKSGARLMALPEATEVNDKLLARLTDPGLQKLLTYSQERGMPAKRSRVAAVLTADGNLAVVEILTFDSKQARLRWHVGTPKAFISHAARTSTGATTQPTSQPASDEQAVREAARGFAAALWEADLPRMKRLSAGQAEGWLAQDPEGTDPYYVLIGFHEVALKRLAARYHVTVTPTFKSKAQFVNAIQDVAVADELAMARISGQTKEEAILLLQKMDGRWWFIGAAAPSELTTMTMQQAMEQHGAEFRKVVAQGRLLQMGYPPTSQPASQKAQPRSEKLRAATGDILKNRGLREDETWQKLASLVQPGMTLADVFAVFPPSVGALSGWHAPSQRYSYKTTLPVTGVSRWIEVQLSEAPAGLGQETVKAQPLTKQSMAAQTTPGPASQVRNRGEQADSPKGPVPERNPRYSSRPAGSEK